MEMKVIGIDLGKSVFHLVGMDQHGKVVARKRLSRSQMMVFTAKIPHCLILWNRAVAVTLLERH